MIISIDGIDGTGKSTVCPVLAEKFPTSIVIKGVTDKHVDRLAYGSASIDIRMLYYLASFCDNLIKANQEKHPVIIIDRSFYSTLAYHHALGAKLVIANLDEICPIIDHKFFLGSRTGHWRDRLNERQELDWYEQKLLADITLSSRIETFYQSAGLIEINEDSIELMAQDIFNKSPNK